MPAHSVNAYYHPLLNEIVFPAGILQPPFFYADADDAVNYGAIGAVIGHEITHGFDDRGSRFDAEGHLRDWWTEKDRAEFDRRAKVLVEQFDGYEVAEGLSVNGRLTLGENIADLGGLAIALSALREALGDGEPPLVDGLTAEQRFFLSWATVWRTNYTEEYARLLVNIDPHSPARFRVNGPLANTTAFVEAFGIAEGSPMVLGADRARSHLVAACAPSNRNPLGSIVTTGGHRAKSGYKRPTASRSSDAMEVGAGSSPAERRLMVPAQGSECCHERLRLIPPSRRPHRAWRQCSTTTSRPTARNRRRVLRGELRGRGRQDRQRLGAPLREVRDSLGDRQREIGSRLG